MATIKCSEPVATIAWNWRDGWQKPRLGWGGRMCELTRRESFFVTCRSLPFRAC